MDQHSFENQIKNQLDDFAMNPSSMVWQRVEHQLPKQTYKRTWLAIAAILIVSILGVGGYYLLNIGERLRGIAQNQQKLISTTKHVPKTSTINNHATNNQSNSSFTKANSMQSHQILKSGPNIKAKSLSNTNSAMLSKKGAMRYSRNVYAVATNKNKGSNKKNVAASSTEDMPKKYSTKMEYQIFNEPKSEKNSITADRIVSTLTKISNIKITTLDFKKTDPNIAAVPIQGRAKRTIEWSMHMTNGISWQVNKSNNITSTSLVNYGTIIYGNTSGGKQPTQKTSYAYSIGANMSFPISNRLSVGGGISYISLSTLVQLGRVINAPYVVNQGNQGSAIVYSYYQAEGVKNTYTTQQQSLQIPVFVEWEILNRKRFPVWVTAGVSMLKQINANDILYDPTTNVSRKTDNTSINDVQWQLTFGTKTTLWQKNKLSIQAGPYYQVGLGNVYKQYLLQNANWQMLGLKAQFNFGGK